MRGIFDFDPGHRADGLLAAAVFLCLLRGLDRRRLCSGGGQPPGGPAPAGAGRGAGGAVGPISRRVRKGHGPGAGQRFGQEDRQAGAEQPGPAGWGPVRREPLGHARLCAAAPGGFPGPRGDPQGHFKSVYRAVWPKICPQQDQAADGQTAVLWHHRRGRLAGRRGRRAGGVRRDHGSGSDGAGHGAGGCAGIRHV